MKWKRGNSQQCVHIAIQMTVSTLVTNRFQICHLYYSLDSPNLATELHGSSFTPPSSILANIPPSITCTCCRVLEKARTLSAILSVCETGVRFGEKEGNTLIIDRPGTSVDSLYCHRALYLTKWHSQGVFAVVQRVDWECLNAKRS